MRDFIYPILFFVLLGCLPESPAEKPNSFTGKNLKGEVKTCSPMPEDRACTEVFTPEDQFGMDCRGKGMTAIQCDCHDWICLDSQEKGR